MYLIIVRIDISLDILAFREYEIFETNFLTIVIAFEQIIYLSLRNIARFRVVIRNGNTVPSILFIDMVTLNDTK